MNAELFLQVQIEGFAIVGAITRSYFKTLRKTIMKQAI